jgi:hypothetical protein
MFSLMDRKVRLPRVWSNRELEKMGPFFDGRVVNVSGWKDSDKQGKRYKEYFPNAREYAVSNFIAEAKGMQGNLENEFFLDLEKDLEEHLIGYYDVVFNHTVLEHVFDCSKAFANLCLLSKDIVIIVVPFIQHQHAAYGDFWRFTPVCLSELFKRNSLELLYINYNDGKNQSVYVIAVGSKRPEKWAVIKNLPGNKIDRMSEKVGYGVLSQTLMYNAVDISKKLFHRMYRSLKKTG